jgi:hypothetical protein
MALPYHGHSNSARTSHQPGSHDLGSLQSPKVKRHCRDSTPVEDFPKCRDQHHIVTGSDAGPLSKTLESPSRSLRNSAVRVGGFAQQGHLCAIFQTNDPPQNAPRTSPLHTTAKPQVRQPPTLDPHTQNRQAATGDNYHPSRDGGPGVDGKNQRMGTPLWLQTCSQPVTVLYHVDARPRKPRRINTSPSAAWVCVEDSITFHPLPRAEFLRVLSQLCGGCGL